MHHELGNYLLAILIPERNESLSVVNNVKIGTVDTKTPVNFPGCAGCVPEGLLQSISIHMTTAAQCCIPSIVLACYRNGTE